MGVRVGGLGDGEGREGCGGGVLWIGRGGDTYHLRTTAGGGIGGDFGGFGVLGRGG